ncbi:hypothetical protein [Mycolicibacterium goodii]|uniref:Mammalian cell entry protein n=1 Tax=Mycolicibacterium goodii TaxID=134601 RepID=A0A0K0X3M9_MYCGD|nr:mammalian cell entry protein [Mycolicibacterium goodii]
MAVDADATRDELTEEHPGGTEPGTGRDSRKQSTPEAKGVRGALLIGVLMLAVVGALTGWLSWRTQQAEQNQRLNEMLLQAGRQAAVNLTTMNFEHIQQDIQRVLDGSAGSFYDDFEQRAPAFEEVVTKTQSKTEGTVTEAGIESVDGDTGRVLVAVSVKTSNSAAPEQQPRLWRMRIDVQRFGDVAKVTNVGFVA